MKWLKTAFFGGARSNFDPHRHEDFNSSALQALTNDQIISLTAAQPEGFHRSLCEMEIARRAAILPRVVAFIAALSAVFAGFSAYQSRVAAEESRAQNASSVLFQSRLEAQNRYIEAYGQLDTALQLIAAQSPSADLDFEEPTELEQASIEDLERAAQIAGQAIPAFGQYQRQVNASRGVWSEEIEAEIVHAAEDARVASGCYMAAASPPMTDEELLTKRAALLSNCRSLAVKYSDFRNASNSAVNFMVAATRAALEGVGADRAATMPSAE